jgi:hypothetical protein
MPFLTLAAFSAAAGILILWIFKLTSNQGALKATRRRVMSHLLAMRLFAAEPSVVLRSQFRLLAWNLRYIALLLPPFVAVAIPLYFAWDSMDALWGRAPLAPGDTAIVTAKLRANAPPVQLIAPAWLAIETPPVRILAENSVVWRVRVRRAGSGEVGVRAGSEIARQRMEARPGLHYLGERSTRPRGPVEWVEVRYPGAQPGVLGVHASWIVWFCAISTLAALALRGKMRVTL